jgi:predicted lipid-binding transport protein (Tim44 family)
VQKKAERTKKLIDFIYKNDQSISFDLFKKTANDTFLTLQKCWQSRNYDEMKPLMMTDLYQEHLQQINSMKRNHEINVMEGLKVDFVEIVRIRYYDKKEKREFTALIQASMKDWYMDDRSNEFIRGDDEPAAFQEFWTFQYDGKNWILRQIEQTKESDALTERNFVEMFTPEQMRQIYGEAESKDSGPVGPWVETDIKTRDDRIHRHLNFLIQTDKIWDENEMKEIVRNIFIAYHVAREAGELGNIKNFLSAGVFESLQETVDMWKSKGDSIEFRNLCVRRVDIVLLRNFSDNTKDEFTARITAHAQKVIKQNGNIVKQDEYVTPFEQYWTFGRKDNKWLLKEILPPAVSLSGKSNIDEDASKEQMEWYYTKDRAV